MRHKWEPPWVKLRQAAEEGAERILRAGRRAWAAVKPPTGLVFYHDKYKYPNNPILDRYRGEKILGYCIREGCVGSTWVRYPGEVGMHQLARVHDFSYLESINSPDTLVRIFGRDILRMDMDAVIESQRKMVAGTVEAAREAVKSSYGAQYMVNLGGGFHHAAHDRGGGFCIFNDVAVAIKVLRREGFDGRVLIVDLDLHHGDGTRRIFASDEMVYTFSIHAASWDDAPCVASYDVALQSGIGDSTYLGELDKALPKVFREAAPDLVFYVAGVDVAMDDRQGNWRLTPDGIFLRDRRVVEAAGNLPMVWVLAGGYGKDAWRHSARSLCWLLGDRLDSIPSQSEQELVKVRKIAASLNTQDLSGESGDGDFLDAADIFADLIGPPKQAKLLDFYTKTGMETALERYGILPHIRDAGYQHVELDIDANYSRGQRLRVFDRESGWLLVELALRDSREFAPYRLLSVEWLVMQNPKAKPSTDRMLLPGQKYPGLGALRKLFLMLVMVCERLNFDGIQFCPSHYHVAAQARGILAFLDPRDAAWFATLEGAVSGLPLAKATHLVHEKHFVYSESGEPVQWRPAPMVLPVSERLRSRIYSDEYQEELEDALKDFKLEKSEHGQGAFTEN